MAKKKALKKSSPRKRLGRKQMFRTSYARTISFLIGVVTVAAIALLIFSYAQTNNYHQVLGGQTQTQNK